MNRGTHAKSLIRMKDVAIATPDGRALFKITKLDVYPGDRIVVLGQNGVGKSTFVRLLRSALVDGQEVPGVRVTPSLVTGYIDQALSDIPLDQTPFNFIAGKAQSEAHTRSSLATAGITYDWQSRSIKKLSLGQRSRLALLALHFAEPNFYLLDEPTNHVDIPGQEALTEEIKLRGASCVLVSHDRTFVRDVGTRFLSIEKGGLRESENPEGYFSA